MIQYLQQILEEQLGEYEIFIDYQDGETEVHRTIEAAAEAILEHFADTGSNLVDSVVAYSTLDGRVPVPLGCSWSLTFEQI